MKKYTLAFLFLFFLSLSSAGAGEAKFHIRFAVISDCHIKANAIDNPGNFKLLYYAPEMLSIVISEINALNADDNLSNNIDFVLFNGDNCDGNQIAHYNLLTDILKELKAPFYMVNGDWDYWDDFSPVTIGKSFDCPYSNLRELVLFEDSACPGLRKHDYSIDITTSDGDLVHLIGIDNVLHFNGTRGSYEPEQLLWLEDDLNLNKGKPTIILQHCTVLTPYASDIDTKPQNAKWIPYCLETELSGKSPSNEFIRNIPWRKDRAVDRSREFLEIIAEYEVPVVLMGDLHLNKKISYPQDNPSTILALNPALASYPSAWTIYEMDNDSISWDVRSIEKYARMSEEYDRRSLEAFNSAFEKLSGDKYQYNIEKTLMLSYGNSEDERNDWKGTQFF